jgi:hypothetical protein
MSMQCNVNRMSTIRRETCKPRYIFILFSQRGSTSMCSWIILYSLREDPRASIYLLCICVCLVCRMKLFSKDIPHSKTFFTILGEGGIDYLVSVCVLAVSSSPRMFYSDSKIKHFPKNTSPRGKRLFAVHVVCITLYLKVLLVSWKHVSHFKKYKNLLLVARQISYCL